MLKFIGSGSAFNTNLGNTSAYIKENKILLLIDCGELTFNRILQMNLLDDVEEIHMMCTHTHSDHIGSLGSLILYSYFVRGIRPKFYYPNEDFLHVVTLMGVTEKHCEFVYLSPAAYGCIECLNVGFTYYSTNHVDELKSYGIEIVCNDKTLYYSGDSNVLNESVLRMLKLNNYHLYQDTCKADYEGNVHLSLRKLSELIPYEFRNRVYCMHLDGEFSVDEVKQLGFNVVENEKI